MTDSTKAWPEARISVGDEFVLAEIHRMLPPKGDEWMWHTYSAIEVDSIVRWLLKKVEAALSGLVPDPVQEKTTADVAVVGGDQATTDGSGTLP